MVKVNPYDNDPGEGTIWFDYFNVAGAPSPQEKNDLGAIIGGVVGGISILILLVLLLRFYCRRRLSKDIPVDPCELLHNHQSYISHTFSSSSPLRPYPAKHKTTYYSIYRAVPHYAQQ